MLRFFLMLHANFFKSANMFHGFIQKITLAQFLDTVFNRKRIGPRTKYSALRHTAYEEGWG